MKAGSRYLVDSSAWIEYLFGTNEGKKAAQFIEKPENTIITPNIVLAEVVSKYCRLGEDPTDAIASISSLSTEIMERRDVYETAGMKHAELRRKYKSIGLADCIVLAIAEKEDAIIITKDHHLSEKNAINLRK